MKKIVAFTAPGVVRKDDHPGAPGRVAKQSANLRRAADLGYSAAKVLEEGEGWALHEHVQGPTLGQACPLDQEQMAALLAMRTKMLEGGHYIGDLNRGNLVWRNGEWVIIDCGAIRKHRTEDYIAAKLRLKWRRVTPPLPI